MKCPHCQTFETKVIDSRMNQTADITRRRRECPKCHSRFTTYERIEEIIPAIIKKDGRREAYNREKLAHGLHKSCQKRNISTQKIEECVGRIEKQMQATGLKEIPSRSMGEMVMRELHALDKVAYVRFASVYRDFRDLEEFVTEIRELPPVTDDTGALAFPFFETQPKSPEGNA